MYPIKQVNVDGQNTYDFGMNNIRSYMKRGGDGLAYDGGRCGGCMFYIGSGFILTVNVLDLYFSCKVALSWSASSI